jgi:hypothetical protein
MTDPDDARLRALAAIAARQRYGATAEQIGGAVARGDRQADREALGLSLGTDLVKRGFVGVTSSNRFVLGAFMRRPVR